MSRYIHLTLEDDEQMERIAIALSTKIRRDILRLINQNSYNVMEIAERLGIPVSTAAFNIKALEAADLVNIQIKPGLRGTSKIISRKIDDISMKFLTSNGSKNASTLNLDIPIGSFADANVEPSCGLASEDHIIGLDDIPGMFFAPEKIDAQIIWFSKGYLEYKIPNYFLSGAIPISLTASMELCSEVPNYRNDWKSDITFWINGKEICTWTSPGDFGGRQGRLNPSWWSNISTQFGLIKTIRIDNTGTYLDGEHIADTSLKHFDISSSSYFTFRIGIKPDAKQPGGINLFGEKFGDYEQHIKMSFDYIQNEQHD